MNVLINTSFCRLVSRIRENHQGRESQENLQVHYRLETFDSGLNVEKENSGVFSKYILSVFPHVKIERLGDGKDRKRFYVGIELKPLLPLHNLSDRLF